ASVRLPARSRSVPASRRPFSALASAFVAPASHARANPAVVPRPTRRSGPAARDASSATLHRESRRTYAPAMTLAATPSTEKPALLPLPPQPSGVPWPTRSWPQADLDPRVDRAALTRLLDRAFAENEPEDLERTNAVVVVQ